MPVDTFAQDHIDQLYQLIGYVLERCPHQCDEEMERRFDAILKSFRTYAAATATDAIPPEELIGTDELGRNYQTAHAAILQIAMNRIRKASVGGTIAEVEKILTELDGKVERNFEHFFAEPFTNGL